MSGEILPLFIGEVPPPNFVFDASKSEVVVVFASSCAPIGTFRLASYLLRRKKAAGIAIITTIAITMPIIKPTLDDSSCGGFSAWITAYFANDSVFTSTFFLIGVSDLT